MSDATTTFRSRFPALSQQVYGKPLVYFDNAATSQKPDCVLEMQKKMTELCSFPKAKTAKSFVLKLWNCWKNLIYRQYLKVPK